MELTRLGLLLALAQGRGLAVVSAQAVFRGSAVTVDGAPVAGAEILVLPIRLSVVTDRLGNFTLAGIPPGASTITVRAVGYEPVHLEHDFGPADTLTRAFVLRRSAVTLDSVVVKAAPVELTGKMANFSRRRGMGFGRFYLQSDLTAREHSTLTDFLRQVAGFRLIRRPDKCGGGFSAAGSRGAPMAQMSWMACYGGSPRDPTTAFPAACYLTVYLDGVRVWTWGSYEPSNLDDYSIATLQGIEIYRGPAELPTELQATGSACGAIVLWTK